MRPLSKAERCSRPLLCTYIRHIVDINLRLCQVADRRIRFDFKYWLKDIWIIIVDGVTTMHV